MAFIEISNLDAADSNPSVSADSFLTELKKTDTVQIFGGRRSSSSRSSAASTSYCCWYTPPTCEPSGGGDGSVDASRSNGSGNAPRRRGR